MPGMVTELEPWVLRAAILGIFALMGFRMWRAAIALRAQGRSLRPKLPADALFAESGASGNSEKSLITRFGGASRVLIVWLDRRQLVVEMSFPFNMFMYRNPYDLEHRVPIEAITSVEEGAHRAIHVSFYDSDARPHTLRLFVKHPDALLAALKSVGTPAGKTPEPN